MADVHAAWCDLPDDRRRRHPLAPRVDAWQRLDPVTPRDARAIAHRHGGALFVRAPGIASAALLSPVAEAVVADGEPFASRAPAGALLFRRQALPVRAALTVDRAAPWSARSVR